MKTAVLLVAQIVGYSVVYSVDKWAPSRVAKTAVLLVAKTVVLLVAQMVGY